MKHPILVFVSLVIRCLRMLLETGLLDIQALGDTAQVDSCIVDAFRVFRVFSAPFRGLHNPEDTSWSLCVDRLPAPCK